MLRGSEGISITASDPPAEESELEKRGWSNSNSPEDVEADVVDLLSKIVCLEVELVRLGDLLDSSAPDVFALEVARPLVTDGDVAVPEVIGVD